MSVLWLRIIAKELNCPAEVLDLTQVSFLSCQCSVAMISLMLIEFSQDLFQIIKVSCLKIYPLSILKFLNCPTNFGICRNSMLWSHLWHHNLTMDSFWTMYSGRIAFGCQKQFLRNPKYFSRWYSFLESTFLVWLSGMFLIPCSHTLFVLFDWIFTGMKNCSIVMLFPDMV